MSKATDELMNTLHGAVATELLAKVTSGAATAQELQAAIKFLKDNNVTSAIEPGSKLDALHNALPEFDEDGVVVNFSR